jgi:hypothetical protein
MKTLFLYVILCFLSIQSFAQPGVATDRIVLHDQRVHEGVILEQIPGERILLYRTATKDTLTIEMDDISRMIRIVPEPAESPKSVKKETGKTGSDFKPYNISSVYGMVHYARGGGDYAIQGFGLSFGSNTYWGLQLGISAQYLAGEAVEDQTQPARQTVPLGLDARYIIKSSRQGRFTTLLAVSGGYNFTLNGQYFDEAYQTNFKIGNGVFFHPGIAFRVNLWQNTGLMFDIGYLFNSASLTHVASGEKTRQLAWHNILLRGSFFF